MITSKEERESNVILFHSVNPQIFINENILISHSEAIDQLKRLYLSSPDIRSFIPISIFFRGLLEFFIDNGTNFYIHQDIKLIFHNFPKVLSINARQIQGYITNPREWAIRFATEAVKINKQRFGIRNGLLRMKKNIVTKHLEFDFAAFSRNLNREELQIAIQWINKKPNDNNENGINGGNKCQICLLKIN